MSRDRTLLRLAAVLAAAATGCSESDAPTEPPPPAPPTEVTVSPAEINFGAVGSTVQLRVEVRDANANVMAGATVSWTSDNTRVATVDATGLVTATGTGLAQIEAQAGPARGYAVVRVEQLPASLEKTEGDGQRALELSVLPVRPTVRVLDANGHPIDGAGVAFRVTEGGGSAAPAGASVARRNRPFP